MASKFDIGGADQPEWLCAWSQFTLSEEEQAGSTVDRLSNGFHGIRGITAAEIETSQADAELMKRCLESSGLGDLTRATRAFARLVRALRLTEFRPMSPEVRQATRDLHQALKTWLASFRTMDDRTSAWLSRAYGGQETPEYLEFKRLLSHEFDHNFAYRLCCGLRNIVEHQDDVLKINFNTKLDPATGETVRSVQLLLDPEHLVAIGAGMRPATRAELRKVSEALSAELVMLSVMSSCEVVHVGLLRALWPRIESAVERVKSYQREAEEKAGAHASAVFLPSSTDPVELSRGNGKMTVRTNPLVEAQVLDVTVRAELQVFSTEDTRDAVWQDFIIP